MLFSSFANWAGLEPSIFHIVASSSHWLLERILSEEEVLCHLFRPSEESVLKPLYKKATKIWFRLLKDFAYSLHQWTTMEDTRHMSPELAALVYNELSFILSNWSMQYVSILINHPRLGFRILPPFERQSTRSHNDRRFANALNRKCCVVVREEKKSQNGKICKVRRNRKHGEKIRQIVMITGERQKLVSIGWLQKIKATTKPQEDLWKAQVRGQG